MNSNQLRPRLFLDADMLLFRHAVAREREIQWDDDIWILYCDASEIRDAYWAEVNDLVEACGVPKEDAVHCFTDKSMFRRRIDPEYKANRKGQRKPLGFKALRAEVLAMPYAYIHYELEADDAISILAWRARAEGRHYVIVSGDKDLRQIPGIHYNPWKQGGAEITDVTEEESWRLTWLQCLMGDSTDGVPGCPGIGPKTAAKLLDPVADLDDAEAWDVVLGAYEKEMKKAGQPTEDSWKVVAKMMNLTRLLHPEDITDDGIQLWQPPFLRSGTLHTPGASLDHLKPRRLQPLTISSLSTAPT